MRSISLPKAAADGGASLPGRPMTLRAIWQRVWQELLQHRCWRPSWAGVNQGYSKVAGGTNNHLVDGLLILPHRQAKSKCQLVRLSSQ